MTNRAGTPEEALCISSRKLDERDAKRDSRVVVRSTVEEGLGKGQLSVLDQRIVIRAVHPECIWQLALRLAWWSQKVYYLRLRIVLTLS